MESVLFRHLKNSRARSGLEEQTAQASTLAPCLLLGKNISVAISFRFSSVNMPRIFISVESRRQDILLAIHGRHLP